MKHNHIAGGNKYGAPPNDHIVMTVLAITDMILLGETMINGFMKRLTFFKRTLSTCILLSYYISRTSVN